MSRAPTGRGRPAERQSVIHVRVSREEHQRILAAARLPAVWARGELSLSQWVRARLITAAEEEGR